MKIHTVYLWRPGGFILFFFFFGGEIVSVPGFSVNRFYIYKSPGVLAGHHR